MASVRWSSRMAVKTVLMVAAMAATMAIMVECNQTLVMAATGGVTKEDDGELTKKTWAQVGDLVNEEWYGQHRVKDIGQYIAGVAKRVKLKANEVIKGSSNFAKEKVHGETTKTRDDEEL